jgi:hypothetical protein
LIDRTRLFQFGIEHVSLNSKNERMGRAFNFHRLPVRSLYLPNAGFQLDCHRNLNFSQHLNTLPAKSVKAGETNQHSGSSGSFMKTLKNYLFVAVGFALVAGCWPHNANAETPSAIVITNAPAPPVTPVVPPPNIVPGSPYAEVVRLTQAGVDQSIIMAYVTNCTSLFNLDSEKIIYLSDLGAPSSLVTAMMQHDQLLQQQFAVNQAAQQAQQAPPVQTAPASENTPTNIADVTPPPAPEPPVTVNYFYDTLAPYGSWVMINGYGRCWRPTVCVYNSGWQPYCDNGHWVYSDCGWYWASSYAWGSTFHYGRWFRDASVGWCWYPDTVWAPSWVTWRYSNHYCGWAPLPPRTTYQAGAGFIYNGGNVSAGYNFGLGANCYTFVPTPYFCNPHPRNYCVTPAQVTQIYNNTMVINDYNVINRTIVNHGIAVQNIAVATGTQIRPVPVRQVNNTVVQGRQRQPFKNPANVPVANHPGYTRDFGSPLRTPNSSPGYFPQQQSQHNNAVAMAQPHPVPAAGYHPQPQATPAQTPAVNHYNPNPQYAPRQWQPTGTPRNQTQQNYYHSAPQTPAPMNTPAPAQSQQGGNQHQSGSYQQSGYQQQGGNQQSGNQQQGGGRNWNGGNQNWPGH